MNNSVLVIGGGAAGCAAALQLADAGVHVVLVESKATLGGKLASILEKDAPEAPAPSEIPSLAAVASHSNIEIFTLTDVTDVTGEPGHLTVMFRQRQRFVNSACDQCNGCRNVCPVVTSNEYDAGLTFRKAIFQPFRTAVPATYVIDLDSCLNDPPNYLPCQRCVQECHVNAIHFDVPLSKIFTREVGSVILAAGYDLVGVDGLEPYGYGSHPDILTSMELERMFTVSGITGGFISKPSNEEEPESVLIVVCDNTPFTWTYSVSHASRLLSQELGHIMLLGTATAPSRINPNDYLTGPVRDRVEVGRGQVQSIKSTDQNKLKVDYTDPDGANVSKEFDMVVLASAVRPPAGLGPFAETLGVALGSDGYVAVTEKDGERVLTSRPGVYAAGCVSGPKNIDAAVSQSSAAVRQALSHLGGAHVKPIAEVSKGGNGHQEPAPAKTAAPAAVSVEQQLDEFVKLLIKLGENTP
ncbi:MAG: CoB--CoM heterodisulfide reductase iron-sulfur subunit A family protein [Candidatus Hydrogenedentes bacterium]|nr:CoB--CoM heterodisulfide reductase iron-sulfur subunit A family protein [Candidatus Hydrogenedentota bacterium]